MQAILKNHKIFAVIFAVTVVALTYVHQQVLIYQMGLKVKENREIYSKLVDRNRILGYNVLNLKSPLSLHTRLLAKKVELQMPRKWQVVRLNHSPVSYAHKNVPKNGLFANLFRIGREAEASPNVKDRAYSQNNSNDIATRYCLDETDNGCPVRE